MQTSANAEVPAIRQPAPASPQARLRAKCLLVNDFATRGRGVVPGTESAPPVSELEFSLPDEAIGVYRALVEHALEPMVAVDRRGEIVLANRAAARIFGKGEQIAASNFFAFVHPEDVDRLRSTFDRALADLDSSIPTELRIRVNGGDWRLIECAVRGLVDNVTLYGLVHLRDISARRVLEARLRHAQKLTKLGRLTVTLAYDLDDLINTIRTHIRTVIAGSTSQEAPFSVRAVKKAAEAAGELSRQLMVFGQTTVAISAPVDVHAMLTDLADQIRRIRGDAIWLKVGLAGTRSVVRLEKENLERALLNLLIHMHEAMPLGGTIVIGTRDVSVPGTSASTHWTDFLVVDIGNGVFAEPMDIEARLFEPPFDMPDGSMIALDLLLLHDIVTVAGGFIEMAATGERGIAIRVFLPFA